MSGQETIRVGGGTVSVGWDRGPGSSVVVALAHGAGGSLHTPALTSYARALADRGYDVVRFNFPYSEAKKKAPDRAPVLEACWRSVIDHLARDYERVIVGGRSMGGRIASHVVAQGTRAEGLLFLAYPLHPPGKPERIRDAHLYDIAVPMLFVQGTRDPFATPALLASKVAKLPTATLHVVDGGDHSHKVRGRTESDVRDEIVTVTARWIEDSITPGTSR